MSVEEQKGITLVALVIGIIVLLILATVSINLIINNGILDKAKYGVDRYSDGEIEEKIKLAKLEYQTAMATGTNKTEQQYIQDSLFNTLKKNVVVTEAGTNYKIKIEGKNKTYILRDDGAVLGTKSYSITSTVSKGTSNGAITIEEDGTATVTLSANSDYILPSSITVSGATHTYSSSTGVVKLSNPTENVIISAVCLEETLYGYYTFDGTENWQFHTSGEPNTYGFYNCYLLGTIPENIHNKAKLNGNGFAESTTDNLYFNRHITATEGRATTKSAGYNLFARDPSIFFRFDSTIATSLNGFKDYLNNNPITIIYKKK